MFSLTGPVTTTPSAWRGEATIRRVANCPLWTGLDTIRAEETSAQVELQRRALGRDRLRRTDLGALRASVRTARRIEHGKTAKAIRKYRLLGRIGNRPVSL